MSKVLKFIVHFVVICTILCVLALAVPPFFGVTAEIRDDSETESNLSMGSVTYAIPVKSDQIAIGDTILAEKEGGIYRLNISTTDLTTNSGTAVDATVSQAEPVNISFGEYMPKVVVTIPLIGYLMVATQSVEGMIILGLAVLFLVILYIIAELWKKDADEDDYEEEDTEPGYVKSKKELKAEERRKARRLRKEEEEIRSEGKASKKKPVRTVRTGGFVDEIEEEEDEEYDEYEEEPETIVQTATSEAHEVLKKEIAAATAEQAAPVRKKKSQTRPAPVEQEKAPTPDTTEESEENEEEEEEKPVPVKRLAIPRRTAEQLLKKAQKAGDNPEVVKDDITGVTLLDYSDLFYDGSEEDEEE